MKNKKLILGAVGLIIVAIIIITTFGYVINNYSTNNNTKLTNNSNTSNFSNTTNQSKEISNNKDKKVSYSSYCKICGAGLSSSEANNEYTQGKTCLKCAKNEYYQTEKGSKYANKKLGVEPAEEIYTESYEYYE